MKKAQWAEDFFKGNIVIYSGIEKWIRQSRNWMKKFLIDEMGCKKEDIVFNKMWCEWSLFAKIGEQWWYFNSGDPRIGLRGFLVRKASGPKDYTGGKNLFVYYGSQDFAEELRDVLRTGYTQSTIWGMYN